jgi:hypothetical protein
MRIAAIATLLAALACAARTSAAAEPGASPSADALFTSGKAAMERGDLATACHDLAESQRLDPAAGTLLNLGECEARSGKLVLALAHFREGRAGLAAGDFRIPFADEKLSSLSKRVPRLAFEVAGEKPAGARVTLDGADVAEGAQRAGLAVDPGTHEATLAADGFETIRVNVAVAEGETKTVALGPVRPLRASPVAPRAQPEPGSSGASQRTAGLVTLGVGALSLGAGATLGVLAKVTYDSASSPSHCPNGPSSCDASGVSGGQTAHTEATAATGFFIAAGFLAATGAALYFSAPNDSRIGIAPAVSSRGGGLWLQGAF